MLNTLLTLFEGWRLVNPVIWTGFPILGDGECILANNLVASLKYFKNSASGKA